MSAPASIGLIIPSGNRLTEPQFQCLCAAGRRHSRHPPAHDRKIS